MNYNVGFLFDLDLDLIPFVAIYMLCCGLLSVLFASKSPPVCKGWPGLPSTGRIERRSVRLLDKYVTIARHGTYTGNYCLFNSILFQRDFSYVTEVYLLFRKYPRVSQSHIPIYVYSQTLYLSTWFAMTVIESYNYVCRGI